MAALSNYLRDKLRRRLFRSEAYTFPATIYLSLHTDPTAADGSGTEVSGGSYARLGVATSTGEWTPDGSNDGLTTNTNVQTFSPVATADWGVITHGAAWDAATVGNMLFHGPLNGPVTVLTGQTFVYQVGEISFEFT